MSEQAEHRFDEKWEKETAETGPMICGRLDMASYDGKTGEPFKNVYIRDAVMTVKGLFCDHVAYAANRFQPLKTELAALRDELARVKGERDELANRAREVTCVWCGHHFESTLRSQAEHLYEHAKTCEKHPVRIAESKLAAAVAERDEAAEALRPFAACAKGSYSISSLSTDDFDRAAAVVAKKEGKDG